MHVKIIDVILTLGRPWEWCTKFGRIDFIK